MLQAPKPLHGVDLISATAKQQDNLGAGLRDWLMRPLVSRGMWGCVQKGLGPWPSLASRKTVLFTLAFANDKP